jgi:mono/diheme cytochrome c family protein
MRIGIIVLFAVTLLNVMPIGLVWGQNQAEGKKLYATYCSGCHGEKGKGDGPAAKSLPIKPADHTDGAVMNQLSDKFLVDVISKGGGSVGKSSFMPAWGSQLKEKQLGDIIAYLRSIAEPPYTNKPAGR